MSAPKKPQDRLPKAADVPATFTFEHEGVTYTLPPIQSVAAGVPGRVMRDAVMGGEEGQLRLAFFMIEKLDGAEDAVNALYSKLAPEMLGIVQSWMTFKPESGVSLGE